MDGLWICRFLSARLVLLDVFLLSTSVFGADFNPPQTERPVPPPSVIGPLVIPSGGTMMFNCSTRSVRTPGAHVSWFRPKDNVQVSSNTQVIPSMQNRVRVLHNPQTGDYNLVLRFAQFPQDNGTWWCHVFQGPRVAYNLIVLVPPTNQRPQITPPSGIIFQVTSEAWTFDCASQHAYPPVVLQWVKKSGPEAEFGALPPAMTVAEDGTIATRVKLIVSPLNHGSEFSCIAHHISFRGKAFSSEIQFVIADTKAMSSGMSMSALPEITRDASAGNVGLVLVSATVLIVLAVAGCVLAIRRKHWHLDVRSPSPVLYTAVPISDTSDTATEKSNSNGLLPAKSLEVLSPDKRERRRCLRKVAVGGVLLFALLVLVGYIIPVYIKGFPVPVRGVDEIAAVMAGSTLWLDCSSLASNPENLLMVGWRKNKDLFYSQINNPTLRALGRIGFPANSSVGQTLGARAETHALGQLSISPMLAGDEGLYICEIGRVLDNNGRTIFQRKFVAVAVITGPPINIGLIVLAALAAILVISLIVLGSYHSIRCSPLPPVSSRPSSSQRSTPVKENNLRERAPTAETEKLADNVEQDELVDNAA